MPKAIVDAAKGLYQTAGAGLFINSGAPLVLSVSTEATGAQTLDATTVVHVLINGTRATLPASAETGAVKVLLVKGSTGHAAVIEPANTNLVTDGATLTVTASGVGSDDAVNDYAVCVFDGTQWIVGNSAA